MNSSTLMKIVAFSAVMTGCSTLGAGSPAASDTSSTAHAPGVPARPATAAAAAEGEVLKYGRAMKSPMTLEVYGLNGHVRAALASADVAEVRATKRASRGDPASQRVVVKERPEGTVVCVLYADEADDACKPGRAQDRHDRRDDAEVRIDFELRVPPAIALRADTLNGDIEARELQSDVQAHTLNGVLRLATTGRITGNTLNGAIVATALGPGEPDPIELQTLNGKIEMRLADRSSFDVDASTMRGHVTSDFALPAAASGYGPSVVRGPVGGGGAALHMKTMNGDIEVKRVQ